MEKKAVTIYLFLVFGLALAAEAILLPFGLLTITDPGTLSYVLWAVIFFIPALSSWLASMMAPPHERILPKVWPIPPGPALRIALGVPVVFGLAFLIATVLGYTRPQWDLGPLMAQLEQAQTFSETLRNSMSPFLLVFGLIVTIFLGCTVFAVIAMGSELGWRGFLLPRLLPHGVMRAHLLTGLLWAVWFFPLIFWFYRSATPTGSLIGFTVRALLLALVLSIILGEIVRRHDHLGLAAIFLGSFFAQSEGMWRYLFPIQDPPWTGAFGIISVVLWGIVALMPGILIGRGRLPEKPQEGRRAVESSARE